MFISTGTLVFLTIFVLAIFFILIYLFSNKDNEAKNLKKDLLYALNKIIIRESKDVEILERLDIINANQKWEIEKIYPDSGITGNDVYRFRRIKGNGELEFIDILDYMLWHIDGDKFRNILLVTGSVVSLEIEEELIHLPDGTEKRGNLKIRYYKPE